MNSSKEIENNYNKFQQQYKSNYVDTYMDFLAKRGSSTVKITISDTPSSKEFNIEYNEYKTKLSIDNNFIFDIENKTDNITGVDYIQTEIINFSGGTVSYNGTDNIWDFR